MVGKYKLCISTNKISYSIDIDRAITIISGDSGTGKTTLYEIIRFMNKGGKGVKCNIREMVVALESDDDWEELINKSSNKIFIADENVSYIYRDEFADLAQSSDNYFVFITRRKMSNYTYSYKSIYKLVSNGLNNKLHTELEYRFKNNVKSSNIKGMTPDIVLCEDSNSGYEMVKSVVRNYEVQSAFGKDKIEGIIEGNKNVKYYIIADGAGFGNCIESIVALFNEGVRMTLLLDESFEKMILDYPVFYNMCKKKLDETFMFCDTKLFKSYERYYTYLLNEICKKLYNKQYSKSRLISELKQNDIVAFICNKLLYINKELLLNNKGE